MSTPPTPQPHKHWGRRIIGTIVGLVAVIVVVSVLTNGRGNHPTTAPTNPAAPTRTEPAAPVEATTDPASPVAPTTPTAPTTPALSVAEQQAVDSAQSYLSMGQGFSQAGLFKQLTSSYGEGFAPADATFAISYLHPDWNAQAVESAQGYIKMGGFSRASLLQQLTSSYGEEFTEAQAEYAVAQVGL